jgi:hypothetical protein
MRSTWSAVIGVAATAVVLAGCSSSSGHKTPVAHTVRQSAVAPKLPTQPSSASAQSGSAPDACGLLADAQIPTATKTTVGQHDATPSPLADSTCTWTLSFADPEDVADPSLKVTTAADKDLGAGIDVFQDATRGYASVSGIGEKAAAGKNGRIGPQELVVLENGVVVSVTAEVTGSDDQDELINEALGHLALAAM